MNYYDNRDAEQLRLLTPKIDAFIAQYNNRAATASTCPRQTVFFFPGGMASQLKRATTAFQEGVAAPQVFNYDTVWLGLDTFVGGALNLRMHRDGAGTFRDKDDRIVVADGSVSFAGCSPQEGFIQWCANNNADLYVFDWDWRRRLEETVRFFVGTFLPFFRQRVMNAGLPDPLAGFSLVGHSFGGMIANLVMRGNDPIVANMKNAITVGTPFYGYGGQAHRWFEGEPLLNGPLDIFKTGILKVIASLPALYTLLFLDEATYNDAVNLPLLSGDPNFPLTAYPSMDATTAGLRADPYNPQANGLLVRYPGNTGFDLGELDYGRLQFQQLAAPMAPNLLQKLHSIRGVRTVNDTVGRVTCGWILPNYNNLLTASPIGNAGMVPGDDTQPAWTARLVTNAAARNITIAASDIEHMYLMNHPQVISAIAAILCAPGATVTPPATNPPATEPASPKEVKDFLRWLYRQRKRRKYWPRIDDPDPRALQSFVPPRFKKRIGAIARRIMADIFKRPVPPNASPPRGKKPKPRPDGNKPHRKPKRRKPTKRKK